MQVEVFPLPSVAVNVTEFAPILLHVNIEGDALNKSELQLSEDPASISDPVMVALPAPSRNTVIF